MDAGGGWVEAGSFQGGVGGSWCFFPAEGRWREERVDGRRDGWSDACWVEVLQYPAAHILNAAAARELLGVVIMGWGAVCVCV